MSVHQEVEQLIEPLKHLDPATWQALQALNQQLQVLVLEIEPLTRKSEITGGGISTLPAPTYFTAASTGENLRFTWPHVLGASRYEVRQGPNWETGLFKFRTSNLTADIDPMLYGTYTFHIKSLDNNGDYSFDFLSVSFNVTEILAPTISSRVVDNNVLLNWTIPTSIFNIKHFIISKAGVDTGIVVGSFTTFFETLAGTYAYGVRAVDIAGNVSIIGESSVQVNTPPDFGLQDRRVSDLNGTLEYILKMPATPSYLLCNYIGHTWTAHFVDRIWLTPQNQVSAGYPIYIQPTNLNGSYEEIVDYGLVMNNLIVTITFNTRSITPDDPMTIIVKMATSLDNITYSTFTAGNSQFFKQFRYLKFRLETSGSDKSLVEIYNVTITIDVKRENDGGEVLAVVSDVGGTRVDFKKPFKDIESITTTVKSVTEPFTAIFDFVDIPNPTHFYVYAFDTTGNRVTKTVEWKARGIV